MNIRDDSDTASSAIPRLAQKLGLETAKNVDRALRPQGLTGLQADVLGLVGDGVRTGSRIASELGVDPTSVTRVLDRLESKKLIVRRPSDRDRRVKKVELTTEGQVVLPRARQVAEANRKWYLRHLDEAEADALVRLLRRALRYE